jgi:hypothetical protein
MRHVLKRSSIIVAVCCTLAISGSAFAIAKADSTGSPLRNIDAAVQAPSGTAAIDSTTLAQLQRINARGHEPQLLSEARTLPTTVDGRHVYLVPANNGDLCLFVEGMTETCSAPLAEARPAQFVIVDPDGPGGAGPVAFGVAMDGVRSISFTVAGQSESVPVSGNVFVYRGTPTTSTDDFSAPTATFADGAAVRLP